MKTCQSLDVLYPPFKAEILKGIARANAKGIPVAVFESYRSPERQTELYSQGRTDNKKVVTNAQAWESWHQYGLAVDIALFDGKEWSWNFDPTQVSAFFTSPLLTWGGTFKSVDGPHYEWKNKMTLAEAKAVAQKSSTLSLWLKLS